MFNHLNLLNPVNHIDLLNRLNLVNHLMRFIYTRAFAIFLSGLVLVAVLAVFQIKGILSPVTALFLQIPRPIAYVVKGVTVPAKTFFSTIYHLKNINNDNSRLTAQVNQLQQQVVQLDQEKRENEALRKELGFIDTQSQRYQPCSVLADNPLGLTDTVVLDCGTSRGVVEGSAAVSQGYLVGKIIYSGRDSSTVLLITNSRSSIDTRLSKNGTQGVLHGSFGSGLILDQLSQNDTTEKGTMAVTAGISEKVPRNILIGQVGDVLSSPNDLFKRVAVISPINFDNLQFVFVTK